MSGRTDRVRFPAPTRAGIDHFRASLAGIAAKGSLWVVAVSVLQLASVLTGVMILQPVTALLFATTCPGMVMLDLHSELPDLSGRLLGGLALSIGINVAVVSLLLVTGAWSALLCTVVIAGISFAGAALTRRHVGVGRPSTSEQGTPAW